MHNPSTRAPPPNHAIPPPPPTLKGKPPSPLRYLLLYFLLLTQVLPAQTEADYARALATHLGGVTEVPVTGGRVDILTADHAIEVDWAPKWKESIGQALWYGLQKNTRAGIILLSKGPGDRKYFIQLNSALAHAGLEDKIATWLYPDDFPGVAPAQVEVAPDAGPVTDYWLTSSSKKRHRKTCQQYTRSRGRYCTADEGTPAGCCYRGE